MSAAVPTWQPLSTVNLFKFFTSPAKGPQRVSRQGLLEAPGGHADLAHDQNIRLHPPSSFLLELQKAEEVYLPQVG